MQGHEKPQGREWDGDGDGDRDRDKDRDRERQGCGVRCRAAGRWGKSCRYGVGWWEFIIN